MCTSIRASRLPVYATTHESIDSIIPEVTRTGRRLQERQYHLPLERPSITNYANFDATQAGERIPRSYIVHSVSTGEKQHGLRHLNCSFSYGDFGRSPSNKLSRES